MDKVIEQLRKVFGEKKEEKKEGGRECDRTGSLRKIKPVSSDFCSLTISVSVLGKNSCVYRRHCA